MKSLLVSCSLIVFAPYVFFAGCAEVGEEDLDLLREEFESELSVAEDRISALQLELVSVKGDTGELNNNLESLDGNVDLVEEDVGNLKAEQKDIKTRQAEFQTDIDNIDSRLTAVEESTVSTSPPNTEVPDIDSEQRVTITQIEVTNEWEFSRLEIEVHMFDHEHNFLGCAGQINGLRRVDASNIRYEVEGFFTTPENRHLTFEDIKDKEVYLIVIEDDVAPCPSPGVGGIFPVTDDVVGTSALFAGSEIAGTKDMTFDNVTFLRITLTFQ